MRLSYRAWRSGGGLIEKIAASAPATQSLQRLAVR
jgi:hypothetical protein